VIIGRVVTAIAIFEVNLFSSFKREDYVL
jgi:hypothetical protein